MKIQWFIPVLLGGLLVACSSAAPDPDAAADAARMPRGDGAHGPAPGHAAAGPGIAIADAWARATAPGSTVGAAYFTLRNDGPGSDVLLSVASAAAQSAELHRTSVEHDVARMRPAGEIGIGPGHTLAAEPGGLHVMLTGLHAPLVEGTQVPLELTFRHAGTMTVAVTVRPAATGGMLLGHTEQGAYVGR